MKKKMTLKDLVFIETEKGFKNPCTGQVVKKGRLPKGAIIVKSQDDAERIYGVNSSEHYRY